MRQLLLSLVDVSFDIPVIMEITETPAEIKAVCLSGRSRGAKNANVLPLFNSSRQLFLFSLKYRDLKALLYRYLIDIKFYPGPSHK